MQTPNGELHGKMSIGTPYRFITQRNTPAFASLPARQLLPPVKRFITVSENIIHVFFLFINPFSKKQNKGLNQNDSALTFSVPTYR